MTDREYIMQRVLTSTDKEAEEILFGMELIMQGATAEEAIEALKQNRKEEAAHETV